jgi:hypothetical protein
MIDLRTGLLIRKRLGYSRFSSMFIYKYAYFYTKICSGMWYPRFSSCLCRSMPVLHEHMYRPIEIFIRMSYITHLNMPIPIDSHYSPTYSTTIICAFNITLLRSACQFVYLAALQFVYPVELRYLQDLGLARTRQIYNRQYLQCVLKTSV